MHGTHLREMGLGIIVVITQNSASDHLSLFSQQAPIIQEFSSDRTSGRLAVYFAPLIQDI